MSSLWEKNHQHIISLVTELPTINLSGDRISICPLFGKGTTNAFSFVTKLPTNNLSGDRK
jgi:hypothetical protein